MNCGATKAAKRRQEFSPGRQKGVNELAGLFETGVIPLLAEEGWTRHEENVPLPIWRGRGGQFGEIVQA